MMLLFNGCNIGEYNKTHNYVMFCIGYETYTRIFHNQYKTYDIFNLEPAVSCVADTPVLDLEMYIS